MDILKKIWPFSFGEGLIKAIVIYIVIDIAAGIVISVTSGIPIIGAIIGLVLGLAGLYALVGIVLAILKKLDVLK